MLFLSTMLCVICIGFYFYFVVTAAQFPIFDYHFWFTLVMCGFTGYGFIVSLSTFLEHLIPV